MTAPRRAIAKAAGGRVLGYCTNVHAGTTLAEVEANLTRHAAAVKAIVSPHTRLPVGLWLAAPAAAALRAAGGGGAFARTLQRLGLRAYTFNGFPYGDFHEEVVKHRVYRPTWADPARARYTIDLAELLAQLLEEGEEGSISTLPIGWPADAPPDADAAANLASVAQHLHRLEERSGRLIHLDLEPEPGCVIGRGAELVGWMEAHVLRGDDAILRRHLRVCHDICHAAVMFESQAELFALYKRAGLRVGKVQISSAIVAVGGAAAELHGFQDHRYLHQTNVLQGGSTRFFEDLPQALAAAGPGAADAEWRVHFHVPVDLDAIGGLRTTRPMITECLELLQDEPVRHFEVETYAWGVLPAPLRAGSLAEGIAREIEWVRAAAPSGFFA